MFRRKPKLQMDWSQIEATAPGRFVLIGDYGDLDDRNAIALAIDRSLKVTIKPHKEEGKLRINLKNFNDTREWPTSLPIFTMTKLVASYAETLVYNDSMQQTIKPLLNPKYYQSKLKLEKNDDQQPYEANCSNSESKTTRSTTTIATTDRTSISSSSSSSNLKASTTTSATADATTTTTTATTTTTTSSSGSSSTKIGDNHDPSNDQVVENPKQRTLKEDNLERKLSSCFLFEDEQEASRRELTMGEHADSAVTAFLILYMAISDSFSGSIRPSLDIEVESQIPVCRGLGSSSAYAVAMCAALMKVFRVSAEPSIIVDWAQNIDKFYHLETSNLHPSVVANGGYIYYQNNRMKFCGVPHSLQLKALLIDTGIRRNPKFMNSSFVRKALKRQDPGNAALNSLNDLVAQTWRQMCDPQFNPSSIYQQLRIAQETWAATFNLSHEKIYELCSLAQQSQLIVKQSQAGETVFLLYNESSDSLSNKEFQNNLSKLGYKFEEHVINFAGLKVTATRIAKN